MIEQIRKIESPTYGTAELYKEDGDYKVKLPDWRGYPVHNFKNSINDAEIFIERMGY